MVSMTGFCGMANLFSRNFNHNGNLSNSEAGWISGSFLYWVRNSKHHFFSQYGQILLMQENYIVFLHFLDALGYYYFLFLQVMHLMHPYVGPLVGAGLAGHLYAWITKSLTLDLTRSPEKKYVAVLHFFFFGLGVCILILTFLVFLKSYQISWEHAFIFASVILFLCAFPFIIIFLEERLKK